MELKKRIPLLVVASLFSSMVLAEQVNVGVSATVTNVYDPYSVISDIQPGSTIGGQYHYETSTPDSDPAFGMAHYQHASGTGGFDLALNGYNFTTNTQSPHPFDLYVMDEAWMPGEEGIHAMSWDNQMSSGLHIDYINLDLYGTSGNALSSELLTTNIPDLQKFNMNRTLEISGSRNGQYFSISAQLDQLVNANEPPIEATATQYTYKITAMIDSTYDPGGHLGSTLTQGNIINAFYTIDTATQGESPYTPEEVIYRHAPGTGHMKVDLGTFSVESISPEVIVKNGDFSQYDHIWLNSRELTSSSSIIRPGLLDFGFHDQYGSLLTNTNMVTDPTILSGFMTKSIYLSGTDTYNTNWWEVSANITSIELVPNAFTESVITEVVPGTGPIHHTQRFDAAIYLHDRAPVMAVSGSINGYDASYPLQNCQIHPEMNNTQPIICHYMNYFLMPGENNVQLQLHLMDQTTETVEVIWTVD